MFKSNKYTKHYFLLIEKAIKQDRKKLSKKNNGFIYYEEHHIIPKSLGGSDDINNLVLLIPREHFIAHWLLTKMVLNEFHYQKMIHAFSGMLNWKEKRELTSRQYQIIKEHVSKRKQSPESNLKRSQKLKGRVSTRKGKTLAEFYGDENKAKEVVSKFSKSLTGIKKPGTSAAMISLWKQRKEIRNLYL